MPLVLLSLLVGVHFFQSNLGLESELAISKLYLLHLVLYSESYPSFTFSYNLIIFWFFFKVLCIQKKFSLMKRQPMIYENAIKESSSGPWYEDQEDLVSFTGFSVVDYPIPNQSP